MKGLLTLLFLSLTLRATDDDDDGRRKAGRENEMVAGCIGLVASMPLRLNVLCSALDHRGKHLQELDSILLTI